MTANPLDIPHILDAITADLSLADIFNCVLVCQSWRQNLTPVLWENIITYRPEPSTKEDEDREGEEEKDTDEEVIQYESNYASTESQQYLVQNSQYIQTLTIQDVDLLKVLVDSKQCVNLTELDYTIDKTTSSVLGFHLLAELCTQNQRLKALSIENLDVKDIQGAESLKQMLAKLRDHPSLTSLYVGPTNVEDDFPPKLAEEVLLSMLLRYRQKFSEVTSLTFTCYSMGRLPKGSPNIGTSQVTTTERSRCYWKDEDSSYHNNRDAIAIYDEVPGEIIVRYLSFMIPDSTNIVSRFLKNCPELRKLKFPFFGFEQEEIFVDLTEICPLLTDLDLYTNRPSSEEALKLLDSLSGIRSFSPLSINSLGNSATGLAAHFSTLENIVFSKTAVSMTNALSILSSCPKLKCFKVPKCIIYSADSSKLLPWACQDLHTLHMGIYVEGQDSFIYSESHGSTENFIPEAHTLATKLAGSFREELNNCRELRDLELWLGEESPFLTLDLNYEHGLPSLIGLSKLRIVIIDGFSMKKSQEVEEWVAEHWPYATWKPFADLIL
ncbi:hypothetical protein BGX26_010847 [Mortierella sp. AD094]|nr:hypothetical protein BGX26_010847 [Mortierella sp. AD094]